MAPSVRTRRIFRELLPAVVDVAPRLICIIAVGEAEDFPARRDFAMCGLVEPGTAEIIVAPKIEREPDDVIHALLRHELAHAILLYAGHADHSEKQADALAEQLWGDPISYDERDVQTIGPGRRTRPARLHQ